MMTYWTFSIRSLNTNENTSLFARAKERLFIIYFRGGFMKILIVPMAAMAETKGPFSRVSHLAQAFLNEGFEVALCAAKDENYHEIDGVKCYKLDVPVPMGLPKAIGCRTFPIAKKLGLMSKKTVHSFEEVLHLTGAISKKYFKQSIEEIRAAIKEYKPDLVYSEFNLSAIIAAKFEGIKVYCSYSYPVQPSYAASMQYAKGVNEVLSEYGLKNVKSSLDIFNMADKKIVPSCFALEPVEGENVIFTGPFTKNEVSVTEEKRDMIAAYMGNGTISGKKLVKVLTEVFSKTRYEVYLAVPGMRKTDNKNIHIDSRFDFSSILPQSALFINHGGQNSIMDGIIYEVPQLICPGKVFERKYNAESIDKNGAGIYIDEKQFTTDVIKNASLKLLSSDNSDNIKKLKQMLTCLGGTEKVVQVIKADFQLTM